MIAFTAKGVAATELRHLNSRVVVLAEDPDGDGGPCLEISRALSDTRQDRELGMDTYSLSTQTGATFYGGVRSYAIRGPILTIRLEPEARDALGVPGDFSIRLDADAATIERIREALRSMIGDEDPA